MPDMRARHPSPSGPSGGPTSILVSGRYKVQHLGWVPYVRERIFIRIFIAFKSRVLVLLDGTTKEQPPCHRESS
jgi:hypothetical protein